MARSKRSSSQPSRQQRRLARQAAEVRGGGVVAVPREFHALAARVWSEVTGGDGVVLVDGKEVPVERV